MMKTATCAAFLVAVLVGLSGCASTSQTLTCKPATLSSSELCVPPEELPDTMTYSDALQFLLQARAAQKTCFLVAQTLKQILETCP